MPTPGSSSGRTLALVCPGPDFPQSTPTPLTVRSRRGGAGRRNRLGRRRIRRQGRCRIGWRGLRRARARQAGEDEDPAGIDQIGISKAHPISHHPVRVGRPNLVPRSLVAVEAQGNGGEAVAAHHGVGRHGVGRHGIGCQVLADTGVALTTGLSAEGADDTGEIGALGVSGDATSLVAGKGADIGAAAVVAPASPAPIAEPGRTSRAKPRTHPAKWPLRPPARCGSSGWRSAGDHVETEADDDAQPCHPRHGDEKEECETGRTTHVEYPTARPEGNRDAPQHARGRQANHHDDGETGQDGAELRLRRAHHVGPSTDRSDRPHTCSPGAAIMWALVPRGSRIGPRRPGPDWSPSRADSGPSGPPPDSA